jgi:hypothetical protein
MLFSRATMLRPSWMLLQFCNVQAEITSKKKDHDWINKIIIILLLLKGGVLLTVGYTIFGNKSYSYKMYSFKNWMHSFGHMIIKEMFHIPMKLKSELARASMTTSDVSNQWRSNNNLTQIKFTTKNSTILNFGVIFYIF